MRTKILSACLAALALAGCDEPKQKVQPPPSPIAAPKPEVIVPQTAGFIVDAGMMARTEPVKEPDPIGLEHSHTAKVSHLSRAKALRSQGDLAGALAEARRAVFDDPSDEDALLLVSRVARSVRQREIAAQAYGRLAELQPDDAMPLVQQARMLVALGDNEGAVKAGIEAIERDSQNPESYQVVGRAHLAQGELASAISMFQKAVEMNPDHGYALNNLGFAYLRANENERALEALTRAAEILPDVAYVQNNLGVALERTGDVEAAKLAYARSMALSPKYLKARINANRVAKASIPAEVTGGNGASDAAPPEPPHAPELEMLDE
ncbi:MAG: tetratricopeptide repeat protein [Myxococcales bacterium]|nr:tetratricopeptide repeat protein [Myxococcales bacterium]